jgi:cytosine/uracil/thiamine/allantoin permease
MAVLTNKDLEAVPLEGRRWTTWNYAALWIGMSICIPTYQLASGLMEPGRPDQGMNWWQALGTILIANLIVLVPMVLNGHAGARYGIPFPVFARASFGTSGANVPAMLRAVVACGWFGINTWIGGTALAVVVQKTVWPEIEHTRFVDEILGVAEKGPIAYAGKQKNPLAAVTINDVRAVVHGDGSYDCTVEPDKDRVLTIVVTAEGKETSRDKVRVTRGPLDVRSGDFGCFLVFWLVNMVVVWAGIDSIRKLLVVKSFFLPAAALALLLWAYFAAHGSFGDIFSRPSRFARDADFWAFFFPSLTAMVGFWATLSLNIPDFTRYAKGQREQMTGQALGLPASMTAVSFVAVAVTGVTAVLWGKAEWDPVKVVGHFGALAAAFAMFCVVLSTLATNVAANIVSPANDFSNLAPAKISFRTGGYMTGIVGILMLPWKLIADPSGYIFTWLVGYSALLGPIGAILITDYFVIRRTALDVPDLYSEMGRYRYLRGWNPVALVALALGIAPSLPGFLMKIGVVGPVEPWASLFDYAWFVGFGVSAIAYFFGMKLRGADAMRDGKPA